MTEKEACYDVLKILNECGHGAAYLVGGAVRDIYMGREPKDYDIATNIPMDIIETLFTTHDIGKNKDFGIVVIKHESFMFEVAQFRTESDYTDGRRPDDVAFVDSFEEDSKRRDFTMNALAMNEQGEIFDYHNGIDHIQRCVLKAVGRPEERFAEDYLRMLRAIRQAIKYGFVIGSSEWHSIKDHAHHITDISWERITDELYKMASLGGDKFASCLIALKAGGLLEYILPEIDAMSGFEHNERHHPEGDVWEHTIGAIKQYRGNDPLVCLSILFHDVGKPECYSFNETGHHYYKHDYVGFKMFDKIAERLRLSNNDARVIKTCIRHHMRFHDLLKMRAQKVYNLVIDRDFEYLLEVARCDEFSRHMPESLEYWQKVLERIEYIQKNYTGSNSLKNVVTGNIVMELTGATGKRVGEIISLTQKWMLNNSISIDNTEAIHRFIKGQKNDK